MKKSIAVILIAATLGLGLFNNCSNVKFDSLASGDVTKTDITGGLPPTAVIEQAIKDCGDAAAAGKLLESKISVKFEDTRIETGLQNICSATQQDNFDVFSDNGLNDFLASRYEQTKALSLPAGATLCGVKLENNRSAFKYDDVIFLTLNNYVLASNLKSQLGRLASDEVSLSETEKIKLFKYDWLKLRGAPFSNVVDDYCVGESEGLGACSWPISEQPGEINVAFDPKLLIAIGLSAANPEVQSLKFVVTGDNNPELDCYHEELAFDTTLQYFIK